MMSDVQFGETLDALLEFGGLNESSPTPPPPAGDSSGSSSSNSSSGAVNSFEPLNCNPTTMNPTMMLNMMKPLVAVNNVPVSMQQQQQLQQILPNPANSPQRPLHLNHPIMMIQPMQASVPQRATTAQTTPQQLLLPSTALSQQFAMPAPPLPSSTSSSSNSSSPSRQTSSSKAAAAAAARAGSTAKKPTSPMKPTKFRPRKRPAPEHISEDEKEHLKRREERNLREQKRSQQVTNQIERLRQVLSDANVPFKPDKYSTLSAVVQYVKQLQARSTLLDSEHSKILQTIVKTSELASNQYMPTNSTDTPVLSNDLLTDSSRTCTSSPLQQQQQQQQQDEAMVMVNGIDYKSIFKSCPFASSLASIDGRFIDCNKEFEEVCGHSRHELLRGEAELAEVNNNDNNKQQAAASSSAAAADNKPTTDDSASSISSIGGGSSSSPSSARNMSLFNVLKRSDMERVFIAMSDMLKRGSTTTTGSQAESDTWMGDVEFCRIEKEVSKSLPVSVWTFCF